MAGSIAKSEGTRLALFSLDLFAADGYAVRLGLFLR